MKIKVNGYLKIIKWYALTCLFLRLKPYATLLLIDFKPGIKNKMLYK